MSFFALYTYIIPISLFVTIELARLGQAAYMVMDPKMQYAKENSDGSSTMCPMRASNSNLNEDLARVDFIFSDKTGTFTQNSMVMAKWFIAGEAMDEMAQPGVLAATRLVPFTLDNIASNKRIQGSSFSSHRPWHCVTASSRPRTQRPGN